MAPPATSSTGCCWQRCWGWRCCPCSRHHHPPCRGRSASEVNVDGRLQGAAGTRLLGTQLTHLDALLDLDHPGDPAEPTGTQPTLADLLAVVVEGTHAHVAGRIPVGAGEAQSGGLRVVAQGEGRRPEQSKWSDRLVAELILDRDRSPSRHDRGDHGQRGLTGAVGRGGRRADRLTGRGVAHGGTDCTVRGKPGPADAHRITSAGGVPDVLPLHGVDGDRWSRSDVEGCRHVGVERVRGGIAPADVTGLRVRLAVADDTLIEIGDSEDHVAEHQGGATRSRELDRTLDTHLGQRLRRILGSEVHGHRRQFGTHLVRSDEVEPVRRRVSFLESRRKGHGEGEGALTPDRRGSGGREVEQVLAPPRDLRVCGIDATGGVVEVRARRGHVAPAPAFQRDWRSRGTGHEPRQRGSQHHPHHEQGPYASVQHRAILQRSSCGSTRITDA